MVLQPKALVRRAFSKPVGLYCGDGPHPLGCGSAREAGGPRRIRRSAFAAASARRSALGTLATVVSLLGSWIPSLWGDEAASAMSAQRSIPSLFRMLGHVDAVHGTYYLGLHAWVQVLRRIRVLAASAQRHRRGVDRDGGGRAGAAAVDAPGRGGRRHPLRGAAPGDLHGRGGPVVRVQCRGRRLVDRAAGGGDPGSRGIRGAVDRLRRAAGAGHLPVPLRRAVRGGAPRHPGVRAARSGSRGGRSCGDGRRRPAPPSWWRSRCSCLRCTSASRSPTSPPRRRSRLRRSRSGSGLAMPGGSPPPRGCC